MKKESNQESLKEVIDRYLESLKMKDKLSVMDLKKEWSNIVGPSIAKHTTSMFLQKQVLILRIDSSIIKNELSMAKSKLVESINNHFSKEVVKEIVLK